VERIRRGWRLIGDSVRVLRQDPELLVLPLVGLVGFVAVIVGLFAAVYRRMPEAADFHGVRYLALFALFIPASIIPATMNAALIAAACERLNGGDPTLRSGLKAAWRKFPQLLAWTLLSAVVGMVLQVLAERLKIAGRLAQLTIGLAWALATFFVVPILLFESAGPVEAIKRSSSLFNETWGEQAALLGSMGLALFVAVLPLTIVGAVAMVISPIVGVIIFVAVFGGLFVASGALNGVYVAALYRYATAGDAPGPFSRDDLSHAFGPKRGRARRLRRPR